MGVLTLTNKELRSSFSWKYEELVTVREKLEADVLKLHLLRCVINGDVLFEVPEHSDDMLLSDAIETFTLHVEELKTELDNLFELCRTIPKE